MLFGIWFGYLFLWFFADPMFPQLFQRFIAARDRKSLSITVVLYPLITTFLFFLTVSIGVLGRYTFPNLTAAESDAVFPLLLQRYAGAYLSTVLITGSLAALMSTMDSQLLTLTSLITVDFVRFKTREVLKEKTVIVLLGLLGFLIAVRPPQTILDFISKTTFNGLAVLAPTVIGGLYWKRANRWAAAASIAVGEVMVAAFYLIKRLNVPGILPIVPILAVTAIVFAGVSLLTRRPGENTDIVVPVRPGLWPWAVIFGLLFILGNDFWAWNREPLRLMGLPLWVWYYVGLGVILSAAYGVFVSREENA
jgi:SSS family solute:Na+ symporter